MLIYHITRQSEWQAAQEKGEYLPEGYAQDGFIHASFREQVLRTAAKFYAGQNGLVLLQIDTNKLAVEVKGENLEGGSELFPHIYGPLPCSAVIRAASFDPAADGQFSFPTAMQE